MTDIPDPTYPMVAIYVVAPTDLCVNGSRQSDAGIAVDDNGTRQLRGREDKLARKATSRAGDGRSVPDGVAALPPDGISARPAAPEGSLSPQEPGPAILQAEITYLVQLLKRHEFNVTMPSFSDKAVEDPDAIVVLFPMLGDYITEAKDLCIRLTQLFPRAALIQSHPIETSFTVIEELSEIAPSYKNGVNAHAICKRIASRIFEQALTRECAIRHASLITLHDSKEDPQETLPAIPAAVSNPRILITGDASKDFLGLKNILQDHKFEVISTLTILQGLSFLESDRFDGIIIISEETQNDLIKFIKLLGKNEELSRIPTLVLTVKKSLPTARISEYLSAGADTVLLREEMPQALIPEVSQLVSCYRHTQNMRRYLASSIAKVTKDSIRICTRKFFDIHFTNLCTESSLQKFPLAIIAVKFLNPTEDPATDRARLKSMIYASMVARDIDLITRLEPEMLLVACPSITRPQCQLLYRRIFKIMRDLPSVIENQNGYRGLSIHASVIFHRIGETSEEFIARSLNNLKLVKKQSPHVFDPGTSLVK